LLVRPFRPENHLGLEALSWLFQARRADRPYAGGDNHR
jgi:hypothetical protein